MATPMSAADAIEYGKEQVYKDLLAKDVDSDASERVNSYWMRLYPEKYNITFTDDGGYTFNANINPYVHNQNPPGCQLNTDPAQTGSYAQGGQGYSSYVPDKNDLSTSHYGNWLRANGADVQYNETTGMAYAVDKDGQLYWTTVIPDKDNLHSPNYGNWLLAHGADVKRVDGVVYAIDPLAPDENHKYYWTTDAPPEELPKTDNQANDYSFTSNGFNSNPYPDYSKNERLNTNFKVDNKDVIDRVISNVQNNTKLNSCYNDSKNGSLTDAFSTIPPNSFDYSVQINVGDKKTNWVATVGQDIDTFLESDKFQYMAGMAKGLGLSLYYDWDPQKGYNNLSDSERRGYNLTNNIFHLFAPSIKTVVNYGIPPEVPGFPPLALPGSGGTIPVTIAAPPMVRPPQNSTDQDIAKAGQSIWDEVHRLFASTDGSSKAVDNITRTSKIEVSFKQNLKHDTVEFERQLKAQEEGLNSLTVDKYLANRDRYLREGRALEGDAAQQAARNEAYANKIEELRENGLSSAEAKEQASKWMDGQAALHNPDQIAGGDPLNITGMGDIGINSSIGSQWKYRIDAMDEQIRAMAKNMTEEEKKSTYLNIILTK